MVSPHRVFDSRCFALDDFASMAALVPGATLNDAIVAVCAGGLRSYLELNAQLPTADLSAQLQGSLTAEPGGTSQPGLLLRLGTDTDDPVRRLAALHHQATAAPAYAGLAGIRGAAPVASTFTPLLGPARPWFLAGARITYLSALLPISDGRGPAFATTVYDGRVVISLTSCRDLLPDPQVFTECIGASFQQLLGLTESARRSPAGRYQVRSQQPRVPSPGTHNPARRSARKAATSRAAGPAARPRSTTPRR